jgi:hypothetical protein
MINKSDLALKKKKQVKKQKDQTVSSSKLYSIMKQQKSRYYSRDYNKHVKKYYNKRKIIKGKKMGLNKLTREFCHRRKPKEVSDDFQNRRGFTFNSVKEDEILDPEWEETNN